MEMFVAQNFMVAADVAKVRTFYAADGVVEMMRGYIAKNYPETTSNTFDLAVVTSPWTTGTDPINNAIATGYDRPSDEFAVVTAKVELRRAPTPYYIDFSTNVTVQYYRIMGVSSVTINSNVIYSTVSYYFYITSATPGGFFRKRFAGWREHKIIENDNGLIQ